MPAGRCIDQLSVDPHLIAGPAHAAFEHVAHAQFLGDLADRDCPILVSEN